MPECAEPSLFVIFGGTGDLSRRKLLPAIARLMASGELSRGCHVVGIARETTLDDAGFRRIAREALESAEVPTDIIARLCEECLHYQPIGEGTVADFRALRQRLEDLEQQHTLPGNRAFYLALPPRAFGPTIERLGEAGLNSSPGWTRLVIEKPFGRDLASARQLNTQVHQHFDEAQIYRIDHYLGKETVQNLLVFRFANAMFESLWHRDRIQSVQIVVAESLGVGTRAGYYDRAGALRDMVQNHLTQLLTLIAMEVPSAFEADAIRYEKIKVLRAVAPLSERNIRFGQYGAAGSGDAALAGYLDEHGVASDSRTETYVAMKLELDNWRWQGVPFYLCTGKRMPRRLTQVVVRFRSPPVCLFQSMGSCHISADMLVLTLQPDEGFSLHIDVKRPGSPLQIDRIPLSFKYRDQFDAVPEAYQTLVLDILTGDQTLFVHADEVDYSWQLYQPVLDREREIYGYPAGSWGPAEARSLTMAAPGLWEPA